MASELSFDHNSVLLSNIKLGKPIFKTSKTRTLSNYSELVNSTDLSGSHISKSQPRATRTQAAKKDTAYFNVGRWSDEEHLRFVEALFEFGNDWKHVQEYIQTRSCSQARSHAQKFFIKLREIDNFSLELDNSKNIIKALHEAAQAASAVDLKRAKEELLRIHSEKSATEKPAVNRRGSFYSCGMNENLETDCFNYNFLIEEYLPKESLTGRKIKRKKSIESFESYKSQDEQFVYGNFFESSSTPLVPFIRNRKGTEENFRMIGNFH